MFDSGTEHTQALLVPGHNYLGPGNPLDNGQPTNQVDEAARKHDLHYTEAEDAFYTSGNIEQAFQDIQHSDKEFLSQINQIEPDTYTEAFGKCIGQIGIGAKKHIEGILHSTLYPNFSHSENKINVIDIAESENVYSISNQPLQLSVVNARNGTQQCNSTALTFNKHFQIAFESKVLQYKKSNASETSIHGKTDIISYIHSLPWEKLYFYITEREYNTITNNFDTAYVVSVKVKIYNMGVNNPLLVQNSNISYKMTNSNHYLGIWRGFEKHGPVTLGKNIIPNVLYGESLVNLQPATENKTMHTKSIGAVSEMKNIDNRVSFHNITSKFDKLEKMEENTSEAQIYLPPLIDMAVMTFNGNSSIGLIYQTMYKPKDGLFHNKSFSFHNNSVVQHMACEQNMDLAQNGKIADDNYNGTDSMQYNSPIIAYENATIDNIFFRSPRSNTPQIIEGLGIGLLPKRDKAGDNVEAFLELSIHTEIHIRAEAFGSSEWNS